MKIEKDIPIPHGAESTQKYPFLEMAIGDSFLIGEDQAIVRKVRSAASWHNRGQAGKRFMIRKTSEGYRCWRIA